jgi:DNA-binding PadR family transcriptional regulator
MKLSGRELRQRLAKQGARKTGPAFYQLMARLEEARFVQGEYAQKIVEGQIIKERTYRMTAEGEKALRRTLSFYSQRDPSQSTGGLIYA